MTDESKNIRLASEGLLRGSKEFVVYLCTYMHVCLYVLRRSKRAFSSIIIKMQPSFPAYIKATFLFIPVFQQNSLASQQRGIL